MNTTTLTAEKLSSADCYHGSYFQENGFHEEAERPQPVGWQWFAVAYVLAVSIWEQSQCHWLVVIQVTEHRVYWVDCVSTMSQCSICAAAWPALRCCHTLTHRCMSALRVCTIDFHCYHLSLSPSSTRCWSIARCLFHPVDSLELHSNLQGGVSDSFLDLFPSIDAGDADVSGISWLVYPLTNSLINLSNRLRLQISAAKDCRKLICLDEYIDLDDLPQLAESGSSAVKFDPQDKIIRYRLLVPS